MKTQKVVGKATKSKPGYGMDKGFAPPYRGASPVEDGQNINVPRDAQGYAITIQKVNSNLTAAGEGNYIQPFKKVVANEAYLSGKRGYVDVNNQSNIDDAEQGDGRPATAGDEPEEDDDLD
jgi:hypothetical protein